MALSFREAEVPFKLYDIPDIEKVVNLWTDDYLKQQMAYDSSITVEVRHSCILDYFHCIFVMKLSSPL